MAPPAPNLLGADRVDELFQPRPGARARVLARAARYLSRRAGGRRRRRRRWPGGPFARPQRGAVAQP
eukprot:3394411-Lingulodinium_polyedra.AAC.1